MNEKLQIKDLINIQLEERHFELKSNIFDLLIRRSTKALCIFLKFVIFQQMSLNLRKITFEYRKQCVILMILFWFEESQVLY